MYLGRKSNKKPRTLGQKMAGAFYSLGSKIVPNILTSVAVKALPKLLM